MDKNSIRAREMPQCPSLILGAKQSRYQKQRRPAEIDCGVRYFIHLHSISLARHPPHPFRVCSAELC
jgi:hypothetical protein